MLNVIILILEVLYYSLFMKFARPEGKFWKYLLLFGLITILFCFVGTSHIYSYLILTFIMLYGLKYIIKLKISLYDMFIIFIMLLTKIIIELCLFLTIYNFFDKFLFTIIINVSKIFLLIIISKKVAIFYKKLKIEWNLNTFFIRYTFNLLLLIYIILSLIFLIIR